VKLVDREDETSGWPATEIAFAAEACHYADETTREQRRNDYGTTFAGS